VAHALSLPPLTTLPPLPAAERKSKLREAQAEAKREIDALRAEREARLRAPQPGAAALEAKVAKVTAEVERSIAGLAEEYKDNKEKILTLILKVSTLRVWRSRLRPNLTSLLSPALTCPTHYYCLGQMVTTIDNPFAGKK
jgi:hypothetical protein